jgi:GAF domain-containing protein
MGTSTRAKADVASLNKRSTMSADGLSSEPLHGIALWAARAAWMFMFLLTWITFLHGSSIGILRASGMVNPMRGDVGLGYVVALDTALMLLSSGVGLLIFRQKSRDRLGLLVSITLITFGAAGTNTLPLIRMAPKAAELWHLGAEFVLCFGLGSILVFLFTFPDGKFVPAITRPISLIWTIWFLSWPFLPALSPIGDFDGRSTPMAFIVFTVAFTGGALAQVYRRKNLSAVERQQTKWAWFGLLTALIGYFFTNLFIYALVPILTANRNLEFIWLLLPLLNTFTMAAVPITIGMSMMRYRLWDIDPIIHRTVVYGFVTLGLGAFFVAEIIVLQSIFTAIFGQQSEIALIISTLILAVLFGPTRHRMQAMVDRRFYREKVDFQEAFTEFAREIRTIIDLPTLSRTLVQRVTSLLHITYGALFLRHQDGTFRLDDSQKPEDLCELMEVPDLGRVERVSTLSLKPEYVAKLAAGHPITHSMNIGGNLPFMLLVPLLAPARGTGDGITDELIGVLAFGPRRSGQMYSREDQNLLRGLADQAGTAIAVARLIQEQQEETKRREEAERALEARRNSPIGQAEALVERIQNDPNEGIVELMRLGQQAESDPHVAATLNNITPYLAGIPGLEGVARLSEGYRLLMSSVDEPELMIPALRTIINSMQQPPLSNMTDMSYGAVMYRLALDALQVRSIPQITELMPSLKDTLDLSKTVTTMPAVGDHSFPDDFPEFAIMLKCLTGFKVVSEMLHAYERLDTSQDKLSYLASALEKLGKIDHVARTELTGTDSAIMMRIVYTWMNMLNGAMSELQTRAKLSFALLTHHTWQGDVIALVMNVRNDGHGAALNVRVSLAPAQEYTAIEPASAISKLAPDEEVQIEMRVRLRLPENVDQFRVRFVITYDDPRGADQMETFADAVYLLKSENAFQFIPNPYVVGTPLSSGSPLFFGREDVVDFIRQNFSAAHHNNLVLIGQRRTGKTSLLKQLPARLGDEYVTVYLDGQSLSLDPGMANFFLNLSTEITYALEDRGFTPPDMPEFENNPAFTFENVFLAAVMKEIGSRQLLILFDEFEELESAVRRGNLEPSVFGFLRHLIQHNEQICVVFCGTHRLEELASDYWSVLFNISLYRHIGFLERPEAERLITEPVAKYGMRYDDLALDKMWRVTAGHPYFLQLLAHALVNRHNKTERSYITIADVNAALDDILASGEAHFVYLWAESTPEERLTLTALSRTLLLTGYITPVQVVDFLAQHGVQIERRAVSDAMHRLTLRDILRVNNDSDVMVGETYRWKLGLISLWAEKYKSLTRVADEVHA